MVHGSFHCVHDTLVMFGKPVILIIITYFNFDSIFMHAIIYVS